MGTLLVSRVSYRVPELVGRIAADGSIFTYDVAYLSNPHAAPLSASLPLRAEPFSQPQYRPYFEGLLAEGIARQALAAELKLREDDWLAMLVACGRDCIGDIVIADEYAPMPVDAGYVSVTQAEIMHMLESLPQIAEHNADRRLSLAGAQGKTGLAHRPDCTMETGWLSPRGLAATTHMLKTSSMRDVPENEFLCMQAARACGLNVAKVSLLSYATPVLVVERFDRRIVEAREGWHVERLHQEDFCQAFRMLPGSKYAELEGGSVRRIASFLRERSARPVREIMAFAQQLLFSYVIGNCDAHLKNYSLLYRESNGGQSVSFELSPAYDLVCTTLYPKYSRDLAMDLGGARSIDEVTPETLENLARELGIKDHALRRIAKKIAATLVGALDRAGSGDADPVLESTPYVADDLIADIEPRLEVLRAFSR